MTVESDADRATMFADWESALINGATVRGMFNNEYVEAGAIQSRTPTFTCRSVDVPKISDGDFAAIEGNTYIIRVPEYDTTEDMVKLILERQQ